MARIIAPIREIGTSVGRFAGEEARKKTMSPTYCRCSRGFVQWFWERILERPVQVDLLASCMSGAQECQFAIHL